MRPEFDPDILWIIPLILAALYGHILLYEVFR